MLCRVRSQGLRCRGCCFATYSFLQHAVREEGQAQHRLEETEVPELAPDAYDRLLKNTRSWLVECHCLKLNPQKTSSLLSSCVSSQRWHAVRRFRGTHTVWSEASSCTASQCMASATDGSYKAVIVPGPPDFTAWPACWRVYKAALLCLRYPVGETSTCRGNERLVVTVSALDEYFEAFRATTSFQRVAFGPRSGRQVQGRALPKAEAHSYARRRPAIESIARGIRGSTGSSCRYSHGRRASIGAHSHSSWRRPNIECKQW